MSSNNNLIVVPSTSGDKPSSNNLIMFPSKLGSIEQFPTEKIAISATKNYIDRIVNHYAEYVAAQLSAHGIDISSDDFRKRYSFSIECLRSTVYTNFDIPHPLSDALTQLIKAINTPEK